MPVTFPTRLRALTLWPEWGWAVHHLDKRVENRTWALPVGEWFALHAGKHIGGQGPGSEQSGLAAVREMGRRAGWTLIGDLWSFSFAVDAAGRGFNLKAAAVQRSAILGLFRVTRAEPPHRGDLTGWRVRADERPAARVAADVLSEREKQRSRWSEAHDDEHDEGELSDAAACLAGPGFSGPRPHWVGYIFEKHAGDRYAQLRIAAALILAEMERLDRAGEVNRG